MSNINDLPHHLYYTLETPENQKVNHPEFEPCEVAYCKYKGGIQLWDIYIGAKLYDLEGKPFFILPENTMSLALSNQG